VAFLVKVIDGNTERLHNKAFHMVCTRRTYSAPQQEGSKWIWHSYGPH